VQSSPELRSASALAAIADAERRAEALERELYALRTLRAEVEAMQPGLLLERLDGWHAGAAEHYAERVRDVRLGLAGAEHLLADAERAVVTALERSRAGGGLP
jgi:hypothetical protein